jgi:Na+-transporting NADH:ubiquinone oxidoreductase subunit NqrE
VPVTQLIVLFWNLFVLTTPTFVLFLGLFVPVSTVICAVFSSSSSYSNKINNDYKALYEAVWAGGL